LAMAGPKPSVPAAPILQLLGSSMAPLSSCILNHLPVTQCRRRWPLCFIL
jgi:hypothetical protein